MLPEALVNHVAMLGWHPGGGDTREAFNLPQLCTEFRLDEVGRSDAVVLEHKRMTQSRSQSGAATSNLMVEKTVRREDGPP